MYDNFNPANGLPMVGGVGGTDVSGNAWGSSQLPWSSSGWDDLSDN